nr:hypothetical protein BSM_15080 [uncultured archaeon]CBH38492.1 hypothetical protein BSM_19690 [uncultured archaeon]
MVQEDGHRHVPFVTFSAPKPRVLITLLGCNFKCKGCFSLARDTIGERMSVER